MKTYEKPVLVALSLSGNERLCGDCANNGKATIYNDQSLVAILGDIYGNADGTLTRTEYFTENLFANAGDNCTEVVSLELVKYCKFNAADYGLTPLAWS